jgi:hypothetical protein
MNTSGANPRGVRTHTAPSIPVSADPNAIAGSPSGGETSSSGCYFASDIDYVNKDIAYLPNTDYYGNSIFGYKTVATYSSGPYAGKAQVTDAALENASINALDNAAARIRADQNFGVVIYSIGLGGAGEAEHVLLQRVSNDQASPIYNSSRPTGLYVYSPTPAELNDAFYRIASEILRLSL